MNGVLVIQIAVIYTDFAVDLPGRVPEQTLQFFGYQGLGHIIGHAQYPVIPLDLSGIMSGRADNSDIRISPSEFVNQLISQAIRRKHIKQDQVKIGFPEKRKRLFSASRHPDPKTTVFDHLLEWVFGCLRIGD